MFAALDCPGQVISGYSRSADLYPQTSVAAVGLSSQSRDKWRTVVRALEPLKRLRNNWDGLGATAPSAEVVDTAIDLASELNRTNQPSPTTVAPTAAGTILFTWDDSWDDTRYFELEVRAPNRIEWMRIDRGGTVTHG